MSLHEFLTVEIANVAVSNIAAARERVQERRLRLACRD